MNRISRLFTTAAFILTAAFPAFASQPGEPNDVTPMQEELAKLQREWELVLRTGNRTIRSVKKVEGDKTTVTRFDGNGAVISTHASEFTLEIMGRVKIFTYFRVDRTTGRRKGPVSYIYTVDEDTVGEGARSS